MVVDRMRLQTWFLPLSFCLGLSGCGSSGGIKNFFWEPQTLSYAGQTYDLTGGAPDNSGTVYASRYGLLGLNDYQVASPQTIWGHTVSGRTTNEGPTFRPPDSEVWTAWRDGWTGAGTSLLVIDDLVTGTHGTVVASIASQLAPGTTIFGKDTSAGNDIFNPAAPLLLDGSDSGLSGATKVHAVNLSFYVGEPWALVNSTIASSLKDLTGFRYAGVELADSVVAVAAGNDGAVVSSGTQPLAATLLNDNSLYERTLVVGALTVNLATGSKTLADYSNRPGSDTTIQDRFLVASGHANWVDGSFAIDGAQQSYANTVGTSFAAPRVAAIATIVRQKFPNLTGSQTATVLLNTATYDNLSCAPSCDTALYGQGEISLRRALAPVGSLQ